MKTQQQLYDRRKLRLSSVKKHLLILIKETYSSYLMVALEQIGLAEKQLDTEWTKAKVMEAKDE